MPDIKLTVDEFALKIKAKYPQYKDMDNYELTNKIVEKYPDYSNSVDLKKKAVLQPGGYGSQLGSQAFQPTEAFVPAPLTEVGKEDQLRSQNIADKFKVPGTQLPKSNLGFKQPEVKATKLDIAPEIKVYRDFNAPTIQQEFGVATPEVKSNIGESITKQGGFQSDILNNIQKIGEVNKAQPKPGNLGILDTISEYLYLPSIGQGFSDVVVKPLAGTTDFFDRTIDKAYTTITGEKTPDWLRKGGGLDAGVKFYEDQYNNRVKPTNLVSEIAEGTLGTLPLIAALATGQGEVSALSKAPQLVSSLTKYFTVKGALNSYKDATDEKLGYIESLNKASKGGLQGFKEGLELDATMLVGGALGKGVAQQLLNKGLLIGGKSTEAVLHALAVGTTFAGTSAGDDLLNGRDINTREALKQFGTGLAFELIPTSQKINADLKDRKNANDINNGAVKSAAIAQSASNLNSESAVRTLLQLTPEQIKAVNDNIKQSKDDLYASSIEAGAKAYEENDPAKKKDLYINQLGLKSQGDIKLVSEKLYEGNKEVKASIENSIELTPEEKADLIYKIDLLTPKEFKENAVQEPSTTGQVPPVTKGGQVVAKGSEGMGQGVKGNEAPQEAPIQEPTAAINKEEVSSVQKRKVYHGADKDFTIEGKKNRIMFTSKDKKYANYYAKQTGGKVFEFDIDESKIAKEDYVKQKIKELNLKTTDGENIDVEDNLHRLIDPRFDDTSISKEGLDKLFSELEKEGYYGVDFMDENQELGGMNEIESTAIFNPKELARLSKQQPKAKTIEAPQEFISEEVSRLREQEQQELAKAIPNIEKYKVDGQVDKSLIKNARDLARYNKIYDKYDKLITPLLAEAPKQGVRTVKLEVNEDLANSGIGLRAVELPDGKFGIFKEVDGKVTGKSLGRSFETIEELQSAYEGGIKDALTAEAIKQAEVKPAEKPVTDSLQKAKDKLAAAKAKLDASKNNMGVAQDPKQRAKDLFDYHSSLVDVAKEYIKYGVKNVKDFAKELGEEVGSSIKAAWDEANGLSKKGMKDFIDATEAELIGITKKDVENLRENMGEDQFEYETQTREKLVERASKKIEDGVNVPDLIDKINNGTKKTIEDIDVEVIRQYYASLTAAINEAPTPELLAQRKALLDALDKAKVSAGRAVQAFDGLIAVEDNLSKFLADESKFADLTAEEITNLTKQYERIQEVHKELEDRFAKLESEAAEKSAKDKIAAIRASERKAKVAAKKMDFKDERKVYVDEFRKRLKEIRSGASVTIFPYQRELVELAPFVAKMVKSYVSEGIFDLKTIVEGVHDQFKNDIEGLSQEDIRDIIAGKYVDTKQTKDAKLAQIRDLKSQARIEGEIEKLKNGIEKETKPVEKRKKSDKLVELEKELKEIKRRTREENAPSALDKKKTYYQNKIDKIKAELASGDFAEVKEPVKITLDSEGLKLQDEYNKLVTETRERRDAKEREAMSKVDKALEIIEQVTGLKRLVQTALDLSIPLRQGIAIMLNPRTAKIGAESYVKMIKSVFNIDGKGLAKFKFDDKFYNRMMSEIERSPNYLESKADGIVYTELGSRSTERRDESHPSESFVYNIPYLSSPFKASERAAAGWTNSARFELYNRGVKQLLAEGKTRENSPQAYEDMAARVMVDTGRGKIPGINDKSPGATDKKIKWALGKTMYGARLFSSTIRKLNPLYYLNPKVDKTVRVEALKDMIGYTTSQILFHVAIASAIGATVSLDPDDSDFLKLRLGKKVIDLTAGQSAYIRTFLRLAKAGYLQSDPSISKEDANKYAKFATSSVGTFFRNKLAPNTSYAVNAFMGSNSIGEKFDPYEVIKIYPMYTEDLITAFEDSSILDAAIILPLAISGLGYQEYSKNVREAKLSNYLDINDSDLKAFLNKNKLTISSDINQEIYNPENGDLEAMNKAQSDKFESAWAKYVMQEVRDNIPVIEAMKSDIFSKNPSSVTKLKLQEFSRKSENKDLTDIELKDKFYQAELRKKISSIKTDANDYAKEIVIGFPKDLLKVEVNIDGKNVPHSLTKQEVDKRVVAYKKYLKENQDTYLLNYNQYIADGATPANAKKFATRDLKLDAVNASGDEILDKYYDESTGEFKF